MGKLTAKLIANAKPKEKPYRMADGGGLYLLVKKSSKLWRYDYRVAGKRKTLSFGVYPETSLKQAREVHAKARKLVQEEIDPSHERKVRKAAKIAEAANSFENIALDWLSRQNWSDKHSKMVKGRLKNHILPIIGKRPISEIQPPEILMLCRRLEAMDKIETAHRIRVICSQVFRYGVSCGICDSDPCRDLAGALRTKPVKHFSAITDPKEIGALLRAIDGYQGNLITRLALRLAPLVFVRPGELRHMEWNEVDLEGALWKIPSKKMKMRRDHVVPLSRQAVEIIKEIKPLTGHGQYVFPSVRSTARPMSDNTLLAALRRMDYPKEKMTVHGFRSIASTRLHEMGTDTNIIELQLAHVDSNSVRAAYNRMERLPERIEMMQVWADYLDELKGKLQKDSEAEHG